MKQSLARGAVYNVICSAGNVLFPLISAAYLSRVLTPEGIGQVAYGQNIVSYFVMFANLGIPQYGTREIAGREGNVDRLFSELVTIQLLATAVSAAAYGTFLALAVPGESLLYRVLGLELLSQLFNIDWLYQGKEEYGYIAARSLTVKLFSLAALLLFVRRREDTVVYGLILCLGTGCNHVVNLLHGGNYAKLTFQGLRLRQHLKPVMALMLSAVTASLYCKVDVTMLGAMAGQEQVGFYTSAHKVVNLVLTLAAAVTGVFLPRLSQMYGGDRESYEACLAMGLKAVLLLALPGCVGLMLTAEDLTAVLFGRAFAPAAPVIRILAVLIVIKGAGDLLCYQALISAGEERKLILARVAAGLANIGLNALLIPRWGCLGAAAASVASELVVNGILLAVFLKIARPRVGGRFLAGAVLCTLVMALTVVFLQKLAENEIVSLVLSVISGVPVYFCGMLLMKRGGFL